MHHSADKLALIRASMEERGVDAYIIPDTDPHLGEYIPDHWRIIRWLTGFTGSAATVIITPSFAGLWTDSRYTVQAEGQLSGSGIMLMKTETGERNGFISWLLNNLEPRSTIGIDGRIFSVSRVRKIKRETEAKHYVIDPECDLVTPLWTDRTPLPADKAFDHPIIFAGRERSQKIREVREEMKRLNAGYHLLASPDEIMWLLNIRGKDIKYSPLLMSYALIGPDQILLFTDEDKIPFPIAREFDKLDIVILPYEETAGMLSTLRSDTILISPSTTSEALFGSISGKLKILEEISIPARMKAVKNKVEVANVAKAMIRDGVTLTEFFYWFFHNTGKVQMTELSLTSKLNILRAQQDNFLCLSFRSIVAFNEHGALPHYSATPESDSPITDNGLLLIDSGSQYLDGTTDITRTVSTGNPTNGQKKDFTLVLKGMISLATSKFPSGTYGYQLDSLARRYLWENGLNYGHGTGHGVGYCLNVHEGPQRISAVAGNDPESYLRPGMIVSDEPAIYREGMYGIRTENLLLCYEDEETEYGKFLGFETLSLCYIDKDLIDLSMLTPEEISWLNNYHAEVYEKIHPYLSPEVQLWLKEKTGSFTIPG